MVILTLSWAILVNLLPMAVPVSTPAGGAYGLFLTIILSLQLFDCTTASGGPGPRVRDAWLPRYVSAGAICAGLALIGLQLLPLVIGATLYNIAVTNGIVVNLFSSRP